MISWVWMAGMALCCAGCSTVLPSIVDVADVRGMLVVGRIEAVVTGETSRIYAPTVRTFEIEHQETHERLTIEIQSDDQYFSVMLPPGAYRLNRVQISEGPFLSMAQLNTVFSVNPDAVTYVGTWRFGVESPRYGRMVMVSIILDQTERGLIRKFLSEEYPALDRQLMVDTLPEPSQTEARLYEVMPYPRYLPYFRRHLW